MLTSPLLDARHPLVVTRRSFIFALEIMKSFSFMILGIFNFDDFVKNKQGRRSRASGSPELHHFTGFPLPRK